MCMKKFDAEKIFFDKQYARVIKSYLLPRFIFHVITFAKLKSNILLRSEPQSSEGCYTILQKGLDKC